MPPKHLIPTLSLLALLTVSCNKPDNHQSEIEELNPHSTWTEEDSSAFWDEDQDSGFTIDTTWDGDTIFVNF